MDDTDKITNLSYTRRVSFVNDEGIWIKGPWETIKLDFN